MGVLLPLVPIIAAMADFAVDVQKQNKDFLSGGMGFGPTTFPTILCSSTDLNVNFYFSALFMEIIMASGCTMLLIIVWNLHKIYKGKREQVVIYIKPNLIG